MQPFLRLFHRQFTSNNNTTCAPRLIISLVPSRDPAAHHRTIDLTRLWVAEEAGTEGSYPLTLMVDNAAGESFCKSTSGLSKLRGVYQMRDSRIKELRDAKIVTAKHVDNKLNLADRLTKGLSHAARQALDQEMDEVKRSLLVRAGGL